MKCNAINVVMGLFIVALLGLTGCGDGGSAATAPPKSASVSVAPSGNNDYIVEGDNMDGVAAISITINYDGSTMSSPTVVQGGFFSGALMVTNTSMPGTIKIAFINAYPKILSGSGQFATISFDAVTGSGTVSVASVNMFDVNGAPIP
jgi:hypothetical protein